MHLILTGASGLVGSAVLDHMVNAPSITAVSILSRRPVPQAEGHKKVEVIIHKDFDVYPSTILDKLKGAEGCVWAQGTSITQVTKEEYRKITHDYPLAAARAFTSLPPSKTPFKFVYVSSKGATTSPGLLTAGYGVIKGQAEAALLALSKEPAYTNLKPYSVRPAAVDPTYHPAIHDFIPEKSTLYNVSAAVLLPTFRAAYKSMVTPTKDLGKVLTDLAKCNGEVLSGEGVEGEGRTVTNIGIMRLAAI